MLRIHSSSVSPFKNLTGFGSWIPERCFSIIISVFDLQCIVRIWRREIRTPVSLERVFISCQNNQSTKSHMAPLSKWNHNSDMVVTVKWGWRMTGGCWARKPVTSVAELLPCCCCPVNHPQHPPISCPTANQVNQGKAFRLNHVDPDWFPWSLKLQEAEHVMMERQTTAGSLLATLCGRAW